MNYYNLLGHFLSGINKSLGIAGKIIPIISDSKPMINGVKSIFNNNQKSKKTNKKTITNNSNSPKFFI